MQSKSATPSSEPTRKRHLFEYAVVRYMPSVERGEFVNVGVVMMCKRERRVIAKFAVNEERIRALYPDADIDTLRQQLVGVQRVADGCYQDAGLIAGLDAHERFRWLTAVRSAGLRTSCPHVGITDNLDITFYSLFRTLVL